MKISQRRQHQLHLDRTIEAALRPEKFAVLGSHPLIEQTLLLVFSLPFTACSEHHLLDIGPI